MKKLLAIAVSVAALPVMASTWTSAQGVRDSLTNVYKDLGCTAASNNCFDGTWGTNNRGGEEYAELLYRIDNLDESLTHITLTKDAVTGKLVASGGSGGSGGFSLAEVIVQVQTFTNAVEFDLFRKTDDTLTYEDTWSPGSADSDGNYTGVTWGYGLATRKLERIVAATNAVNAVISDATATKEDKQKAVDFFFDGTAYTGAVTMTGAPSGWTGFDESDDGTRKGEGDSFNNAVDALKGIADNLGSYTLASHSFGNYQLDATLKDTTYSATGYSLGGRVIDHEDDNDNFFYNSYADYVTGTPSLRTKTWNDSYFTLYTLNIAKTWTITSSSGTYTVTNGTDTATFTCDASAYTCTYGSKTLNVGTGNQANFQEILDDIYDVIGID